MQDHYGKKSKEFIERHKIGPKKLGPKYHIHGQKDLIS